jgi:uncharacterized protein (UPF0332 family)
MTLRDDEREAMSQLYIDKACEALQEAKDNHEQHPNVAVTRAYYSMFYAAQSALIADGVAGLRRHEGVNSNFGEHFVKTKKFPKEVARMMGEAENARYKADYNPGTKFSPQDAGKYLGNAEKFVDSVKKMMLGAREKNSVHEDKSFAADEKSIKEIVPRVGQRVLFQPHCGNTKLVGSVIAMDEYTVTLKCGNTDIPAIRERGTFFEASPFRLEETKEYVQNLARQHAGKSGKVFFARNEGAYKGVIVELTPAYAIQKVNEETAVVHRLEDLKNNKTKEQALIREGESISIIKYGMNVTITLWNKEHENGQDKKQDSQSR